MTQSTAWIASILVACAANTSACAWQKLPSLPEPNGGFICAEYQGRVLVLGGTNWVGKEKKWLTGIYLFDPVNEHWDSLSLLPEPLAHAIVGYTTSGLIVAGGTTGREPFKALLRLEHGRVTVQDAPALPNPAVASAGGVVGDDLIVVGGMNDVADLTGLRRDAFAWNVRTGEHRILPLFPGPVIGITASVVVGDELMVFGGASWDASVREVTNLSEAHAFSPKRNAWRLLRPLPFGVRALAAVTLDANHIYLAGGVQNDGVGITDQALIYHVAEDRYTPATPLPYRAYVGLVQSGGFIYCLGGEDKGMHRTDAVYRISVTDLLK